MTCSNVMIAFVTDTVGTIRHKDKHLCLIICTRPSISEAYANNDIERLVHFQGYGK